LLPDIENPLVVTLVKIVHILINQIGSTNLCLRIFGWNP